MLSQECNWYLVYSLTCALQSCCIIILS